MDEEVKKEEVKPVKTESKKKKVEEPKTNPTFLSALLTTFDIEGGLNTNVKKIDKGGLTKYGVSLRFLKAERIDINADGVIDELDIIELQKKDAEEIFKKYFWDRAQLDKVTSEKTAKHIFDLCINHGVWRASIMVQRTLNGLGANLKQDGVIGKKTIAAINKADEKELNNSLVTRRKIFYDRIVRNDPSQIMFLDGWKKRADKFSIKN